MNHPIPFSNLFIPHRLVYGLLVLLLFNTACDPDEMTNPDDEGPTLVEAVDAVRFTLDGGPYNNTIIEFSDFLMLPTIEDAGDPGFVGYLEEEDKTTIYSIAQWDNRKIEFYLEFTGKTEGDLVLDITDLENLQGLINIDIDKQSGSTDETDEQRVLFMESAFLSVTKYDAVGGRIKGEFSGAFSLDANTIGEITLSAGEFNLERTH